MNNKVKDDMVGRSIVKHYMKKRVADMEVTEIQIFKQPCVSPH